MIKPANVLLWLLVVVCIVLLYRSTTMPGFKTYKTASVTHQIDPGSTIGLGVLSRGHFSRSFV